MGLAYGEGARRVHLQAGSAHIAVAYRAMQEIVVKDLPYVWLVETDFTAAWRNELTGFAPWSGQFAERAARR